MKKREIFRNTFSKQSANFALLKLKKIVEMN